METKAAGASPVDQTVRPTHWMDARGLVVTDAWLQSDKATSDYRAVYTVPVRKTRKGFKFLHRCGACLGSGEDWNEGDPCHACNGVGGLPNA